jgi:hypothetical protein
MARLVAAGLVAVLGAAAGCTELGLTPEALGLAAGSAAPAAAAPVVTRGDLTVNIAEGNEVMVRLCDRDAVRVQVPRDWRSAGVAVDPRVCGSAGDGSGESERHPYHWAVMRWERGTGAPVELVVRTMGESDVCVEVNGRESRLLPGAAVAVTDAERPGLRAVR